MDDEPAFPRDHASFGHNGMMLRDYFASSIIAGLYVSYGGNAPEPEQMAEDAYAIADAMIEARATQQQEG